MPTPLTPDEEFDARFRAGLGHYPEQPENPAAWHRMELLLDADTRHQGLRRKVLRLLGAEAIVLALALFAALHWLPAGHSMAVDTLRKLADVPPAAPALAATLPATTSSRTAATPAPASAASKTAIAPAKTTLLTAADETLAATTEGGATAPQPSIATTAASRLAVAALPRRRRSFGSALLPVAATRRPGHLAHAAEGRALASNSHTTSASAKPVATDAASAARPSVLAERRPGQLARKAAQAATATPATTAAHRPPAARRAAPTGALAATARRATRVASPEPGPANASAAGLPLDLLALRQPTSGLLYGPLPDSLAPVALVARPRPLDSLPLPRPQLLLNAYRLRIGLVAAPEWSAVSLNQLSAPGGDAGVQLDLLLGRRWHVSTSYLFTVKRYSAYGDDYHLPAGNSPHPKWVLNDVNAVCRIVDIPLNLRYDLWQRPRYQVFASAGLSSLAMKREEYTYAYDPVAGQPVPDYTVLLVNGSQHILQVLNLSAGYERALGQRWTMQAEPFVKLPLGGIGFGKVRLSSAGVFFSLRYGLLPARAAKVP